MSKEGEKSDPPRKAKSSKSNGTNFNGGSLEDCFTNVFALTEINGLKWKCYRTPRNAPRGVPLTSDPILVAYSKCVRDGILCAWRRKQLNISSTHETLPLPHFSHDMPKELWVFWYNEESEQMQQYCKDLEMDEEVSSNAAFSNIVSYEVRILYFKSIHIILERSLMKLGYVRFGRWFTKPLKSMPKQMQYMYPTYTIAIRFHFFIHGGNTVCLVMNAQRQPTLIQLQKRHLEHKSMKRFAVIIGPWSMRGMLVQNQFAMLSETKMQASIDREYNNWKSFVVLEDSNDIEKEEDVDIKKEDEEEKENDDQKPSTSSQEDSSDEEEIKEDKKKPNEIKNEVPKMVLVDIDGVRMLYPSKYLCVTLEDDRHVWDALGYRSTTVPEELLVQGRRPRNKFVVQSTNSHIQFQGVIQQVFGPRTRILPKPPLTHGGFAQPFPPMNDEKWLKWKFSDVYESSCEKCYGGKMRCEACRFADRRLKAKNTLTLSKTECIHVNDEIFEHMKLKPDSSAYHRTKNAKTAQMIKFIERQRTLSESSSIATPSKSKKEKEKTKKKDNDENAENEEEDELEEVEDGTIFRKRDDNPWLLDDEDMADWIDLEKESFPILEKAEEDFIGEDSGGTSEDDDIAPAFSPFTPITSVSPCGDECNWPASTLENMTEKVFDQIFRQNSARPVNENATREEKYEKFDSFYDPTLPQIRESPQFQPYHKKRRAKRQPEKGKCAERPFSVHTTIYKGEMCEHGPFGYQKYRKKMDEVEATKEAEEQAKKPIVIRKETLELFEDNVKMAEKLAEKKSIKRCINSLVQIEDEMAHDCKQWKKNNYRRLINTEDNDELDLLDIKKFNENFDEEFKTSIDEKVGYISPYYQSSPSYSNYEELSESEDLDTGKENDIQMRDGNNEEQINDELKGLGEGTSTQQFNQNENELMECDIQAEGITQTTNGVEYGPDGLLSPPASNEMPKSVADDLFPRGVPSIEAPGMNQIYPTPPSVQMLHSDPQQMHSPIAQKILKNTVPNIVEEVERVKVIGDPAKIEEYSSDDEEENLKEWNDQIGNESMKNLLTAFKCAPLSKFKRKSAMPLSEKFALNSEKTKEHGKKNGVYQKMVDSAFENPPFDSFGKLLTQNPYLPQPQTQPQQPNLANQQFQMQQYQLQMQQQQQQQQQQQYQQQQMNMNMQYNSMQQQQQHQQINQQFGYPYQQQPNQQQFQGQFPSPQHHMQQYPMAGGFGRGRMIGPPPMMAGRPPPAYAASVPGPSNMYGSSVQQLNNFVNQPRFGGPQQPSPYMQANFGQGYPQGGFPPQRLPPMYSQPSMPPPQGYQFHSQHFQQNQFHQQQNHSQLQQHLQKPKDSQQQVPEGESIVIALIMSDTILDLHFDTSLDSCPICSCTISIRARELGLYITPHDVLRSSSNPMLNHHQIGPWSGFNVNGSTTCTCGFSAIRHRYLSFCSGLFPEDSNEATALDNSVASVAPPLDLQLPGMEISKNISWVDSKLAADLGVIDQIRSLAQSHSYGKAVSQMAALSEHVDRVSKAMEIGLDVQSASEYVISHVDSMELLMLGNSAIDMCMRSMSVNRNQTISAQKFLTYFHPWGLQTANEIRDPNMTEWRMTLNTILPSIENSIKIARNMDVEGSGNIVEGPLTWRKFVQKSSKNRQNEQQENESLSGAEPIPAVMFSTSNESIKASPMLRTMWNHAMLAPIDQPKDVMYMTIIPDDDVTYAKTLKFMEKLSKQYEKMRLGRHIPFPVSSGAAQARKETHFSNMRKSAMGTPMQSNVGEPMEVDSTTVGTSTPTKTNEGKNDENDGSPLNTFDGNIKWSEQLEPPASWDEMKKFSSEKPELPSDFYDREGILRCGGTRTLPVKMPAHSAATSTEFSNMVKNFNDRTGFISRLKNYLQQMEELVFNALNDNPVAFERYGFKYQNAVEVRLKRDKEAGLYASTKERMNATEEDSNETTTTPTQETSVTPTTTNETQTNTTIPNEKVLTNQIPSPIPAGMVHIPETLPENERNQQPTLTELLSEPSSLLPIGAATMQWVQRDTTLPNPFITSNQPPVDYEEVGAKDKDDPAVLPHVIVIYIVNPFTWGTNQHTALHMRVSILGFIRAFNSILLKLTTKRRPQLQMEIINLDQLEDNGQAFPDYLNDPKIPMDLFAKTGNKSYSKTDDREPPESTLIVETAKSLAIAVYQHPRVFFPDAYKIMQPRCMTAFGPGSQLLRTVDELERLNFDYFKEMRYRGQMNIRGMVPQGRKNYTSYKVPSNLMCLAPAPSLQQPDPEANAVLTPTEEQVLFVTYCLIGSDYLVAAVTDQQGKLIDNCVINMKPRNEPHQLYRFKLRTQILDAMGRLWTFILGVMASDIKNWRLVVGRLGRIGHGEFRAWTHLLNKTSLLKYSSRLKDICNACSQMPGGVGTPSILSACLVTIEPEANLRVIPDYIDPEANVKKSKQLHTPEDLSTTHIITFPVGAEINYETQDPSNDTKAEENWEFGDLDMMAGLDDGDTELLKDVGLTETPSSAAIRPGGIQSFFSDEASIEIQNQPLAAGFYISTAPAPELPDWFWAACPSAKRSVPVHLKSSLHINITEVKNDDLLEAPSKEKEKDKEEEKGFSHPLESHQTEEVLRHVLESYNALSWLNIHPVTGERYSCMPIHIQHLLRLYHSIVRLIM